MSDWMALWTRMNTFPPSRYRCATDIVKVERISQFLFDLAQYLALFRTGRIPIRVGRREAGKGCWGHPWFQSSGFEDRPPSGNFLLSGVGRSLCARAARAAM